MSIKLTVLTPTYNRAGMLRRCWESLCRQTCKDFEWLVIDDGSSDETEKVIMSLKEETPDFEIHYHKKENGGKHTVLNYSHAYIQGELTVILDDDDTLTQDAVETVLAYWEKYQADQKIWCMSFSKGNDQKSPLVPWDGQDEVISNTVDFRVNAGRDGDCAEVVRSEVFKRYQFPVFAGEHFLGEDCMWTSVAFDYNTVYIKRVIYLCEYLEGGLTKSGRGMRLKNPLGGMYRSNIYLDRRFTRKIQVKHAILYDCYAIAAGKPFRHLKKARKPWLCALTLPAGAIFYNRWRARKRT